MKLLKYYGYPYTDYAASKQAVFASNRLIVKRILIFSSLVLIIAALFTYMFTTMAYLRVAYTITAVLITALVLLCRFAAIKKNSTLCAYLYMTIMFSFGIVVATFDRKQTATVFNALLIMLPILFTDHFIRMSAFTAFFSSIFCIVTYLLKPAGVIEHDVMSTIFFWAAAMFLHFQISHSAIGRIISDRQRDEAQCALHIQAQRDALTGLYNRSAFFDLAESHLRKQSVSSSCSALCIMDLDNFKFINDTYGHQVGDQVITGIGNVLKKSLRDTDIIGRLGGDEYIFLLVDIGGGAAAVLDRLLSEVAQIGDHMNLSIQSSVGIIIADDGTDDLDSLYHKADLALYEAKNAGRNRYVFYKDELSRE